MSKKEPLKVGDRVRVRGYCCYGSEIDGEKGKIHEVYSPHKIRVGLDCAEVIYVYPSQCIRLIKKPLRRVWGNYYEGQSLPTLHPNETSAVIDAERSALIFKERVEFIEKRKKK